MSDRWGFDIDGVLADWNTPFAAILTRQTGIEFPVDDPTWPPVWDWMTAAGCTSEQVAAAWEETNASDFFWEDLYPLPGINAIRDLDADIYFITARTGRNVKAQTEHWLKRQGIYNPTVLISNHKGLCAEALYLTHYIDDRYSNCLDVSTNPAVEVFMLDKPYNRYPVDPDLITVVDSVAQAICWPF